MINEMSMVSIDLLNETHTKLSEIFSASIKLPFAGKMNKLLFLELWHLFKYAEITEAVRHSDRTFVNVLNSVCLGTANENIENFLKARFIDPPDKNYSHNALHMYTKNARTILRNQNVLKNLPSEVYSIESNEKMMVVVIYIVNYRSANQSFFS